MTRAVFGLFIYGIPNPEATGSPLPVLYTNGALPTAGRPSELTNATILDLVKGLPGVNWGADPRHPTGSDGSCTVTLSDTDITGQARGLLGQLFLEDRAAPFWGIESNRVTAASTTLTLVNEAFVTDDIPYFLGNECVSVVLNAGPTAGYTRSFDVTRALCGSLAATHVLRPSDYSEGEDGTQDRLYLRSKPDWSAGFLCGVYLFTLTDTGAIKDYMLRRGVVTGEPTPVAGHGYEISIKFIEDRINSHTVGETSKETTLQHHVLVTQIVDGRPQKVSVLLGHKQAGEYYNEAVTVRGDENINAAMVTDLNTRMQADSSIDWQLKLKNDSEWVYRIDKVSRYDWQSNGVFYSALRSDCSLVEDGYQVGATCLTGGDGTDTKLKPWYKNATTGDLSNLAGSVTEGAPPPVITLRLYMQKTIVQAFLTLAISNDGSSGGTYDKLIGGLGAGLPQSYFNLGAASATPLTVNGNTIAMLELDQLLNPTNDFYFDCSKGISLKDFLSNLFIGSQLLLGSLQDGKIALRSWVHEVASAITLAPLNREVVPGKRLTAIKKLDLFYGTRVLDLEPLYHRSIRYLGTSTIGKDEVQALRIWRQGYQFANVFNFIDIFGLVRAFYQVFGGAARVFPVVVSLEDLMTQGIEFAASVRWVDPMIPTPDGLGFDADCFVVGIDCDYEQGEATLLLIENTLLTSPTDTLEGNIAPSLRILSVANVNATTVDVTVDRIDGVAFAPLSDFGGLYVSIRDNASYLWINNFYQAPIGALEKVGDLEAYCKLTVITSGAPDTFRLVVDSDWLRGANIAVVDDLFVVGETRLNLPPRVPAAVNLEGNLIEPDELALPPEQNFVTFMPLRPLYGVAHTFDH